MADITAKDIAAKLGLSPSAVSLALNGKPGVSEKTRGEVLELATQLGYFSRTAGGMPVGRKKTLCFVFYVDVVVSIAEHTSFSTFVLKGVEAAAAKLGYSTMICYFYAGQPIEKQICDLLELADGIILLGTDITPDSLPRIELFIHLACSIPIVILDNYLLSDQVDCVGSDNLKGATLAIQHLLDQGARHIGYFRSRQRIEPFDQREAGIRAALQMAHLPLCPVVDTGISTEAAFADINRWLDTAPCLPEGFMAENDVVAVAALRAFSLRHIKIPEEVAIMGFDDIPICNMVSPPLSTMRVNKELLGALAVNILHQRLTSGSSTSSAQESGLVKQELCPKLLVRESTRLKP